MWWLRVAREYLNNGVNRPDIQRRPFFNRIEGRKNFDKMVVNNGEQIGQQF
jgi:hypothetical protein